MVKVFTSEQRETETKQAKVAGWRRFQIWKWHLSYSDCFNTVFGTFAIIGIGGVIEAVHRHIHPILWYCSLRHLL